MGFGNKNVNVHHLPCPNIENPGVWETLEVRKDWIESNRKKWKIFTDLTPFESCNFTRLPHSTKRNWISHQNQQHVDETWWSKEKWELLQQRIGKLGFRHQDVHFQGMIRDKNEELKWDLNKHYTKEPCVMNHEPQKKTSNPFMALKKKNSIRVNGNHGTSIHFCCLTPPHFCQE